MSSSATTKYAQSADGTRIAYTKYGKGGRPMIIIDGVMGGICSDLPAKLIPYGYTVYYYDRRGRGNSGDTPPYSVEKEMQDFTAIAKDAGGTPSIIGCSSGAVLALYIAASGATLDKLVLYEPPLTGTQQLPPDCLAMLNRMLAHEHYDEAARYFFHDMVHVPSWGVWLMKYLTPRRWQRSVDRAATIPYDYHLLNQSAFLPPQEAANITCPTLVMYGGRTANDLKLAAKKVAASIPGAELRDLPGCIHLVNPKKFAAALHTYFRRDA